MKDLKLDEEGNFFYLLAGLAILLVTGPVLSELFEGGWTIAVELSFSLLLIVGVWSLQSSRQRFILGLVLMAISLLGTTANLIFESELFLWLTIPSRLLFLGLASLVVLEQILLRGKVSLNKIVGAVYVDSKEEKRVVAIRPKAPFMPVFHVATTREDSGVVLFHDPEGEPQIADQPPPGGQEADGIPCLWWRRGRVEPEPSIFCFRNSW